MPPASWSVGADGALNVLTPTPDGVKHLKITPGVDTGLAQLLQAAGTEKKSASAK